jgi:uncharacterized membrane protein
VEEPGEIVAADGGEVVSAGEPEAGSQVVGFAVSSSFSGPLPPPNLLAQYNEVLPDGANRIVTMAERQAKHRQRLETRAQAFALSSR